AAGTARPEAAAEATPAARPTTAAPAAAAAVRTRGADDDRPAARTARTLIAALRLGDALLPAQSQVEVQEALAAVAVAADAVRPVVADVVAVVVEAGGHVVGHARL